MWLIERWRGGVAAISFAFPALSVISRIALWTLDWAARADFLATHFPGSKKMIEFLAHPPAWSLAIALLLAIAFGWAEIKRRPIKNNAAINNQPPLLPPPAPGGGGGAEINSDGGLKAGSGGAGQFWGAGGGGGGGLRENPDGSTDAGGGGGGGGATPGGHGGGPLGGGGGGSPGLPPGFFDTDTAKILMLLQELQHQYAIEFGGSQTALLPEKWVNDQLEKRGSTVRYSTANGNATWTSFQKP